ncbi:uracil-DNA glycosylase family protein [Lacibacterium aquatile]|uniref:Type-4 uracil-DNA glycosylase n=1 Tax=Lacibacterium aquatile TaxID=1168082 RepID=A0ABW5DU59_9PROT
MTPDNALAALLDWYLAVGVDEAIGDVAVDRFRVPDPLPPPSMAEASRPAPAAASGPQQVRHLPARQVLARPAAQSPTDAPESEVRHEGALKAARTIAAEAGTLEALEAAIEAFDACPLKATANRTVIRDGVLGAPVLVVGEAPGQEEDRTGKPFVGPAGQMLDRMLGAIGLSRSENVLITNIIFWRPPANRKPTPQEVALCVPFVRRFIELSQPKLVLLAGATAAQALLDRTDGISRLRGQWFEQSTESDRPIIPTLATYHPSYLLRSPAQKRDAWKDLMMFQERLESLGILIPGREN